MGCTYQSSQCAIVGQTRVLLQGCVFAMLIFPVEMVYTIVCDCLTWQLCDVFVVDSVDVVSASEQEDGVFRLRRVVEQDVCVWFQYDAVHSNVL